MSKKHKHKHKHKAVSPKPVNSSAHEVIQYEKCWQGHPILELGNGVFHGASCIHPHKGYDIYVGLDWGMARQQQYPWHPLPKSPAVDIYFPITDGKIPTDAKEFDAMIDWLAGQLEDGKSVHAGCIGGHGRTGLLLVALVNRITGDKDAGAWVRKHYCHQAVETIEQVQFLQQRYGITEFKPSRTYSWSSSSSWSGGFTSTSSEKEFDTYAPVAGRAIWDASLIRVRT